MEYFTSPDIEQQKYELFATIKADFYIVNIYLCTSLFDNAAKGAWHARMMNCLFLISCLNKLLCTLVCIKFDISASTGNVIWKYALSELGSILFPTHSLGAQKRHGASGHTNSSNHLWGSTFEIFLPKICKTTFKWLRKKFGIILKKLGEYLWRERRYVIYHCIYIWAYEVIYTCTAVVSIFKFDLAFYLHNNWCRLLLQTFQAFSA